MLMLPTRGRLKNLERFIVAYEETGAILPITVIIDSNDRSYDDVALPGHWSIFINPANYNLRDAMNNCFNAQPNDSFYGVIADDLVPMTPHWDTELVESAGKHNIAWPNDGIQGERLCTHPVIGGDLVRAWGYFVSPHTTRHCSDFIWMDFARELGVAKYRGDILLKHLHWQAGTAPFDTTYAIQPSANEGHHQYHNVYKNSATFFEEVMAVKEKLGL